MKAKPQLYSPTFSASSFFSGNFEERKGPSSNGATPHVKRTADEYSSVLLQQCVNILEIGYKRAKVTPKYKLLVKQLQKDCMLWALTFNELASKYKFDETMDDYSIAPTYFAAMKFKSKYQIMDQPNTFRMITDKGLMLAVVAYND